MKVVSHALISFTLEKYKDEILCDVFSMLAGDILFGRPWKFDKKVMYDGYLNRYAFIKDSRKTTLVPLSYVFVFAGQLELEEKEKSLRKKNPKKNKN